MLELFSGANVILGTPTGSGKSLVALAAHVAALAEGRRTFYTAPIKALVSEKFFDLCRELGLGPRRHAHRRRRGEPDAPVICCTAEILANLALRDGERADVGQVVMDEFHYYADPDRGWAWQVPLLTLPQAQFLLMSATLGDTRRFEDELTARTGRPTAVGPATPPGRCRSTSSTGHRHARDDRRPAGHRPGAGLRRALHPAVGGRAGPGADEHQRVHAGREGRHRRGAGRLPLRPRLRQDAVAARAPRHRRPPRRHAPQVPPPGRAAGPGGPPQGHLRHRHARRRHQRPDPHRAVHPALQVRRHAGRGSCRPASSTRSPGGPAGPASTPSATCGPRRPSTSSRTSGRWPRPATTPRSGARSCARSRPSGASCTGPRTRSPSSSPPRPSR